MSLKPLNPHVSADNPVVLNLMSQYSEAVEKVRSPGRGSVIESGSNGNAAEPLLRSGRP